MTAVDPLLSVALWACGRLRTSLNVQRSASDNQGSVHASFRIGDSYIMASDGRCQGKPSFQGFSLSLTRADAATGDRRSPIADRHFNALADGGQVQMPLAKSFLSPRFGIVADRFGCVVDDLRRALTAAAGPTIGRRRSSRPPGNHWAGSRTGALLCPGRLP